METVQMQERKNSSEKSVDSLEDVTNENPKPVEPVVLEPELTNVNKIKESDVMSKSEDFTSTQKSQAFTIDFGDGKQIDSTKHKFLMDKLKKRHQRGASLSKLDDANTPKTVMTKSKTSGGVSKLSKPDNTNKQIIKITSKNKVPMSVSFHESSNFSLNSTTIESKSLSPRTSFHEQFSDEENIRSLPNINTTESPIVISKSHESENEVIKDIDSNSDVSETGTYTIENDTYTEEQKAKMSIDQKQIINNDALSNNNVIINNTSFVHTQNCDYPERNNLNGHINKVSSDKNVLEVSYYYEPPPAEEKAKSRTSVLEKLKNRVRNISERSINNKPKQTDNNLDVGSFTSVTASGVLSNKNPSRNKNEFSIRNELDLLLKRKKSLTKTEIESSDYIESDVIHKNDEIREPSKGINKFENNWIYEWAKSASEHNRRRNAQEKGNNQHYFYDDNKSNNNSEFFGDKQNIDRNYREMSLPLGRTNNDRMNDSIVRRPPRPPSASPTKIPSPISTLARPRSRNSVSLSGSTTELNSPIADTHSYLRNTEDVINILARSLSNSTGPKMSNYATYSDSRNGSPMHSLDSSTSPKHISYVTISSDGETRLSQNQDYNTRPIKSESSPTSPQRVFGPTRHKRHFSFDNSLTNDFSAPSQNRFNNALSQKNNLSKAAYEHSYNLKTQHDYVEKNNKDLGYGEQLPPKPIKCFINKNDTSSKLNIDQTISVSKDNLLKNTFNKTKDSNLQMNNKNSFNDVRNKLAKHQNSPNSSPIRRSSSFSTHINDTPPMRSRHNNTPYMESPRSARKVSNVTYNNYHDDNFSDSIKSDYEYDNEIERTTQKPEKITNTRCNRAFSLRRARLDSEKSDTIKPAVSKPPASNFVRSDYKNNADTQRRSIRSSFRDKSAGPRDASVTKRTTNNKPAEISNDNNTSAGQKKAATNVQPRYMDISKYKSPTSATFLKKDESKSYLETRSASANPKNKSLMRNDDIRLSLRSTRSAGTTGKGVIKKDMVPVRNPSKEQEMANWKRRAKYDPMKAAAEGRKKAELAKKMANSNIMTQSFNENENCAPLNSGGAVLRSQSYHGTVGLEWLSSVNPKSPGFNRAFNRDESISDASDDDINFT